MPLNIGLMMFNPSLGAFFRRCRLMSSGFPKRGRVGTSFQKKSFKDPIPRMTRDALDCIARTFDTVIKHPDRAEATRVANFPFATIEETVVNAVYHRAYDTREPVEVRIETTDLFVISYPAQTARFSWRNCATAGAAPVLSQPAHWRVFERTQVHRRPEPPASPKSCRRCSATARHRQNLSLTKTTSYFWCGCRFTQLHWLRLILRRGMSHGQSTPRLPIKRPEIDQKPSGHHAPGLAVKLGLTPDGIKYPSAKNEIGRSDSACWGHQVGSPGKSKIIATHAYP